MLDKRTNHESAIPASPSRSCSIDPLARVYIFKNNPRHAWPRARERDRSTTEEIFARIILFVEIYNASNITRVHSPSSTPPSPRIFFPRFNTR